MDWMEFGVTTPFVGDQHKKVLEDLHSRYAELREAGKRDGPSVVILEGVSGVGKSRVIRELYSKIRAEQADAYWPPLHVEPDDTYSPLSVRKQIGPPIEQFVWESDALPTFGWWEFNGAKLSTGVAMSMDMQVEEVVKAHTTPIVMARMDEAGFFNRFKGAPLKALKDLREMGEDQMVDKLLGLVAETADGLIPVPGLKLALGWLKGGYDSAAEARRNHDALASSVAQGEEVASGRAKRAALLADSILGLASSGVPGVVVVEDIHLMGESFTAFLDQITRKESAPLIVIGTAWPDAESAGKSVKITQPYRDWRGTAVNAGAAAVLSLGAPPQADRVQIVRKWAPTISPQNAASLTDKIHNPLALELILTSKATKVALRMHNGDLPAGYVAKVPHELSQIYHERLGELDEEVRNALSAVAGSIPNDHQERTWPFVRHHIAAAIEKRGSTLLSEQGFGSPLAATIRELMVDSQSHTWLVTSGLADTFREALMAEVAANHLENDLGLLDEIKDEVLSYLGSWLADLSDDRFELPRTDEVRIVSRWYLSLVRNGSISDDEGARALVSSAYLVAEEQASVGAYDEAARVLGAALSQVPDYIGGRYIGILTGMYLEWILKWKDDEVAGPEAALEAAELLAKRGEDALESTDPSHVSWLFKKGLLHEYLGHTDEAISELEEAFERLPTIKGRPELEPLEIEQHRVTLYESAGRVNDAVMVMARLVNDARANWSHNPVYVQSLTDSLTALLDRHDRGVPGDYFTESDATLASYGDEVAKRAIASMTEIWTTVAQGSISEGVQLLALMFEELENHGSFERKAAEVDSACESLVTNMLEQGMPSEAYDFLSAWCELRPGPAAWKDWLIAAALVELGNTQEAIQAHETGLDRWVRVSGATVADLVVFTHRFELGLLRQNLADVEALARELVVALSSSATVPEPDSSPKTRPNWLMEQYVFLEVEPAQWADTWISTRGDLLLDAVAEIRAGRNRLPVELQRRAGIWEKIGRGAADEDPEALRALHRELVQDADYGAECVEGTAAELLSRRLDRLLELRGGRGDSV